MRQKSMMNVKYFTVAYSAFQSDKQKSMQQKMG